MLSPLIDAAGNRHRPVSDPRILSLVPSLTELIADLGLGDRLVGRTHYCVHPKNLVETIPSVGGTKKINMRRVADLGVTHAILNIDENPKDMAVALSELGIVPVVTQPMTPDDNPALFTFFGRFFEAETAARDLVDAYQNARSALDDTSVYAPKRVLYLIWKDPWMAVRSDTYIGNFLKLVNWTVATPGADPQLQGDAARYPAVHVDAQSLEDIDLVLLSSEPYSFTDADLDDFGNTYPAHAHKAALIDGEMTSWFGSRAVAGLRYLHDLQRTLAR